MFAFIDSHPPIKVLISCTYWTCFNLCAYVISIKSIARPQPRFRGALFIPNKYANLYVGAVLADDNWNGRQLATLKKLYCGGKTMALQSHAGNADKLLDKLTNDRSGRIHVNSGRFAASSNCHV